MDADSARLVRDQVDLDQALRRLDAMVPPA
jgi:hypothetical protein